MRCNTNGLAGVSCSVMCYEKYLGALINMGKKNLWHIFKHIAIPHLVFQMGCEDGGIH